MTSTTKLNVVIMAAGKGTRMKSKTPKVLQKLAGRPLVKHVLSTAAQLGAEKAIVITGHGAEVVEASIKNDQSALVMPDVSFVRQEPQLGTGHAVLQALPLLSPDETVVVLSGDVPLTTAGTLKALVNGPSNALRLLTVKLPDATGYGRVVRNTDNTVSRIVEQKDATIEEQSIKEAYTGIMAVPASLLAKWLPKLTNDNAQGEYYLTDIVAMATAEQVPVIALPITDAVQVAGVNSPAQLAELERALQAKMASALMTAGVRLADPSRLDIRDDHVNQITSEVAVGQDVEIDVNCVLVGKVTLGNDVVIGANCYLANVSVDDGAVIEPNTHIDGGTKLVTIGEGASVGPFARLRPGATLLERSHVGNFVEVKNATIGMGSKAGHLAYIGDATLGSKVNVGAGTIFANYDGANKHHSDIADGVHIGSNSVLVAPIQVEVNATIGAGSCVTKFVPANQLTVARAPAEQNPTWTRPKKNAP